MKRGVPEAGDVFSIDASPTKGRELAATHRFIVITPLEINRLGVSTAVPVTTVGSVPRDFGLGVSIMGHDTTGVAVCNQVRSFDIQARIKDGSARYVEQVDLSILGEIVDRVVSVFDPQ
jgi:mRNA interferase ChpB